MKQARSRRSWPRRAARFVRHVVFDASRAGRSSEIAAWSNALASLGLAGGAYALVRSWPLALAVAVIAFVLLRVALAHRLTVWIAAALGTLAVGAVGGALCWLFGHVLEQAAAPWIAGALGALLSALAPAWAYGSLAQRRERNIRDSLVDPVSVPPSHG